ncbi:DAK2 domain-containing protein [[Mycobacterium] nativiensis]|uniref:DAK2 domain-containing protein n=1 Tax=[Mycobacterium] nativiensis TaxID=2855503 RepID=A0ABU5XXG0_9MYCO|nr:DAK2 domain-containing protein [Mycolicibacter sp. MYC340]MEB3032613.1 DAK2 domain-containing protein [Mycolicibacter sp. MYC340]
MGNLDRRLDAATLRDWAHTAVGDLITHTDEINQLNVFPVADSDTGTNMLFTMRSALAEANTEAASGEVARVAAALSSGALHGARGNSGVILSQILRGLADVTAADTAVAAIDAALLGAGLRHGVELVITSMGGREIPGTIVSVLQAAAAAANRCATDGAELGTAITAATDAAADALDKTTEQLEVLADAGVVDAGGRGLLVLLDALRSTITGQAPVRTVYQPSPRPRMPAAGTEHPAPQFEVMYLLGECAPEDTEALRVRLTQLGESVAIATSGVVGGYSVHVHTDDAGAAVEAGLEFGRPRRIQISALAGAAGPSPGSWARERAVLAVVDGDGAEGLFESEGACVLRPDPHSDDPAMMVSAQQLLRAVVDTGAAQVMLLPNGYVAAEELVAGCTAAIGWGIEVVPVPAGSMVQGLSALAVHDPGRPVVDDGYTMARVAGTTRYGSVRVATEQALTWAGTCRPGDGLGIAGDEVLIVARDVGAAAIGLIDLLLAAGGELVTVLFGDGRDGVEGNVVDVLAKHVHDEHPGIELAIYFTGHRGDVLLIGVE